MKRINQTSVNIFRKIVTTYKRDLNTKLYVALSSYRTIFKVTIQAMIFSLIYNMKAILSIEFKFSSF